jgi:RimJ/RimL family protein N-acetyltransferase
MDLQIAELTEKDFDDLIAFWIQQEGIGLGESDGRPQIASYLVRNPGMSLVARDGGKLIAAILCGHDGRRGYLHHLAVVASHRGRGIGKLLTERCLERLGQAGIAKCNVFIFAANSDGERFWRAVGFKLRDDLKLLQRETGRSPPRAGAPMPMLTTNRLILRDFVDDDGQAVHAYASDPPVTQFMEWGPNTIQQTQAFIERARAQARQLPRNEYHLAVVMKDGDRLIGGCSLVVEPNRQAMLGYCHHRDQWGKGYATEAAGALLEFGFETLRLHRIYSTADVLNVGSWRVMEKIGMKREGQLRESVWCKGRWRNSYLYSILEQEWAASQSRESQ